MTIKEALNNAASQLANGQKRLEVELLLAHTLKRSREFLFIHPEKNLSKQQLASFFLLVERRSKGWPIAYLTNQKEFYGLNFFVDTRVLIPRPETELMVEEALKSIAAKGITKPKAGPPQAEITDYVIDIGTGSGAIIIALAKLFNSDRHSEQQHVDETKFFAIDISGEALKVAKKNARLNRVDKKIKFLQGSLLEPIIKSNPSIINHHLSITANLPYLTPTQVKNSASIKFEPRLALVSGNDGLRHYRQLFRQLMKFRISNYSLFCEIDHTQAASMKKLLKSELPAAKFKIKKDLGRYDRLVIIKNLPTKKSSV